MEYIFSSFDEGKLIKILALIYCNIFFQVFKYFVSVTIVDLFRVDKIVVRVIIVTIVILLGYFTINLYKKNFLGIKLKAFSQFS
jgi:hypothetical protein